MACARCFEQCAHTATSATPPTSLKSPFYAFMGPSL